MTDQPGTTTSVGSTASAEAAGRDAALAALASAGEAGAPVRFVGAGTKLGWGVPVADSDVTEIPTDGLDRLLEHNEGDLTAIVEAGLALAEAQRAFAKADQELLLDPPDPDGTATIGGVIAAGDSGPLRTRYGGPRDLVLGVQVGLSDGSVARAGGKVIKNVAGYDLSKLLTGSLGSLGLILELSLRLHPKPPATATAAGETTDPSVLAAAALELANAPLEARGLDLRFGGGDGALLARFGGAAPRSGAQAAARLMERAGLQTSLVDADDGIWERQREGQRSPGGTALRVSTLPSRFGDLLAAVQRLDGRVVARPGLGLAWVAFEDRSPGEAAEAVRGLRRELSPAPCAVLDAPAEVRSLIDPWPLPAPGPLALMQRVKDRFDPAGVCRPSLS
ncbi:MAG: FAD-binding oxidoreductase [Actinomycetota bacterium]|nr:FAD-binding oxidoreductase [Actinomycetota bacterium]